MTGATSLIDQRLHQLRRQHAGAAVFRAFQRHQAGNDRIIEIESGRSRAAHGEGRGVQFVIGEQHQRAADQIGGVLVVRRPGFGDLQMQRFGRRCRGSAWSRPRAAGCGRRPSRVRPAARVKARGSALAASASTAMVRSIGAAPRAASATARISSGYMRAIVRRKRIDAGRRPTAASRHVRACPFRRDRRSSRRDRSGRPR